MRHDAAASLPAQKRGEHIELLSLKEMFIMIEDIRRHIENKFREAKLERSPFPHVIIENFFPEDVYCDILRFNLFRHNQGASMLGGIASDHLTSRTPYSSRKQIDLHTNAPFDGTEQEKQFWGMMRTLMLQDNWFAQQVVNKYPDYFSIRFGDLTGEKDFLSLFESKLFVQRHEPGYYIGPHSEAPHRVFAGVFSFAENEDFAQYGTELLAHENRLVRCWGCDHHNREGFIVKKIAPYKPNNFFVFYKTRHSFHGVPTLPDNIPNQRYGMQFQFNEANGGVFQDLSVPDIVHFRQPLKQPPAGAVRKLYRKAKQLLKTL